MQEQSARSKITEFLDKKASGAVDMTPFYAFEPYDVGKRPDWVIEQARKDGVDLYTDEMLYHVGADPHKFQTGFLLSVAPFRTIIAGSRNGKTVSDLVELAIMVSGEKPVSMRVDKGVKTGFKRKITKENIVRFGRFDIRSGAFIDYDFNARRPEGWDEWDCGYIEGVGVYPDEKIPKPGETIWIGCTQRALTERWWPAFEGEDDDFFPKEFIDRKRGYNGYMKSENVVFGVRRMRVAMISYESGFRKFEAAGKEAVGIHAVFFDEEPPDQQCVTAAVNRCRYFSLSETPYLGITYTKQLIFNPKKDRRKNQVFHATIYDSPYLDKETIDHRRSLMPPHEIGARIWGLHTELKGKPYFDRMKINAWIRANKVPFQLARFRPFEEYDGMYSRPDHEKPGLFSVEILLEQKAKEENKQDVWRIYEKAREDVAYFLMADSSEGSDVPSESGDVLASLVMRPPMHEEQFPQIVASLRSTLKTVYFARVCSWALRYFNNALLCAEGPTRGSFNAIFYSELVDYPYWYNQPSERWSTRKYRTVKGFDTNVATRPAIFDIITEILSEYDITDTPEIADVPLLQELAGCILATKNGKLRPDHPTGGSLDTTICYGQGIYVWKHNPEQIKCRAEPKKRANRFGELLSRATEPVKGPVYLGEGVENLR